MARGSANKVQSTKCIVLNSIIVCCCVVCGFAYTSQRSRIPQKPRINYSDFSHVTHVEKQKLACDSCHKLPTSNWKELRKGDDAFPDVGEFPTHDSCLNCHRQQFFARERPAPAICANCHVAVTPRNNTRWLFPSLGDVTDSKLQRRNAASEFNVGFPHEKHLEVVGFMRFINDRPFAFTEVTYNSKAEDNPKSCAICHQTRQPQGNSSEEYVTNAPKNLGDAFWLKKGTFKTIPNNHFACFTCHNSESGIPPDAKECGSCHKPSSTESKLRADFDPDLATQMGITDFTVLRQWSGRNSSGTYRHEGGAHPDVSCVSCHKVQTMDTVTPQTLKVAVTSCGGAEGCHATTTSDEGGILNYEIDERRKNPNFVCTKCHIRFGHDPLPAEHVKAIPTPSPSKKPGMNVN